MPDFNKGDFTQQGVNGHVNATVRLNEKRLVNIDMTSNEEAEGCTITGTVTDLLNDKVYNIGSGGGGGGLPENILTFTLINPENEPVTTIQGIATDFTVPIPTDITYPYTAYSLYAVTEELSIAEQLGQVVCDATVFNTNLFTNLVNCELVNEAISEGVLWGINITDPTLSSSLTIDVRAFTPTDE